MAKNSVDVTKINLKSTIAEIESLKKAISQCAEGTDQYKKNMQALSEAEKKWEEEFKKASDTIKNSNSTYKDTATAMSDLKKAWKETSDEATRNNIGKAIGEANQKLKELDATIGNYQRNVGNYESGTVSLKAQLKELTTEMANMLAQGVSPTNEAFVELAQKAGSIKDALGDAKSAIKEYSNDIRGITNTIQVFGDGVAVFGAYKSAMSLLGIESQKFEKVMQKLIAAQTLLNSVNQIAKSLGDSSSVTHKLIYGLLEKLNIVKKKNTIITTENSIAEGVNSAGLVANTGAMVANAGATGLATVALKFFKHALAATGIGAALVIFGEFVAYLLDFVEGLTDANDLLKLFGNNAEESENKIKRLNERLNKNADVVGVGVKKAQEWDAKWKKLVDTVNNARGSQELLTKAVNFYNKEYGNMMGTVKNGAELQKRLHKDIYKSFKLYKEYEIAEAKRARFQELANEAEVRKEKLKYLEKEAVDRINAEKEAQRGIAEAKKKAAQASLDALDPANENLAATRLILQAQIDSYDAQIKKLSERTIALNNNSNIRQGMNNAEKERAYFQDKANNMSGIAAQIGTMLPEGSNTGEKTNRNTRNEPKIDLLEAFNTKQEEGNKKLKEDLETIRHKYAMLDEETANFYENQQGELDETHNRMSKYYSDALDNINNELKNTKLGVEERKKLENQKSNIILEQTKERNQYEENSLKLILKKEKDNNKNLIAVYQDQANERKKVLTKSTDEINATREKEVKKWQDKEGETDFWGNTKDYTEEIKKAQLQALEDAYKAKQDYVDREIAENERLMQSMNPLSDEYQKLAESVRKLKEERASNEEQYQKDQERIGNTEPKQLKKRKANYQDYAKATTSLINLVSDAEKASLDQKVKNGEISEEEAEKEFERIKKMEIASAIITTISGAIGAYMADTKTYKPAALGIAMGIADAATTLAAGYAQIDQIKSTTYGGGGGSRGTMSYIPTTAPLLSPEIDQQSLQMVSADRLGNIENNQQNTRVYVVQKDLEDSHNQSKTRIAQTTF